MAGFNMQSRDLNLLAIFVVVWETRSVSRAAERLSLTQSAVSHALRRLRERTGDALFVPGREGLLPTPRAAEIIGPIQDSLHRIATTLRVRSTFDARESRVELRIGADDLVESWLVPQVLGIAHGEAPGVVMRSIPMPTDRANDALEVGDLQVAIGRRPARTHGIRHELLTRVDIAMMIRKAEAPRTRRMPMQLYLERPHVVIHRYHSGPNVVDIALQGLGLQRRIGASVQSFYTMLATAADTGFLCAVPQPMANRFGQAFGLSAHTLPFKVDPIPLYLLWHERYDADPAIRWIVDCVRRAVARG